MPGAPQRDTTSPTPQLGAGPSGALFPDARALSLWRDPQLHRRPLVRDGPVSGPAGLQGTGTWAGTGTRGPAREESCPGHLSAGPCGILSGDQTLSCREDCTPFSGGQGPLFTAPPAPSIRGLDCPKRKPDSQFPDCTEASGEQGPCRRRGADLPQVGAQGTAQRQGSGVVLPPSWLKGSHFRSEPVCLPPSRTLALKCPRRGCRDKLDVTARGPQTPRAPPSAHH